MQTKRSHKWIISLLGVLLIAIAPAWAAIDVYQFKSEQDRARFQQLTAELRCPKCQNQNIADSNAPIAEDLRNKIHSMLTEQRSDQEIIDYMIARYGDFVLYQPRMDKKTYLLWFGPAVLFFIGLTVVVFIGRKNKASIAANATDNAITPAALDAEQQQQLADILNDSGKQSS